MKLIASKVLEQLYGFTRTHVAPDDKSAANIVDRQCSVKP